MTLHAKMAMANLQQYPFLLCMIHCELDIHAFVYLICLFISVFLHFYFYIFIVNCLLETIKKNFRNKHKRRNFSHYWSDKGFKGIQGNWALPSLHGGSLKITEFVPHFLIKKTNHFFFIILFWQFRIVIHFQKLILIEVRILLIFLGTTVLKVDVMNRNNKLPYFLPYTQRVQVTKHYTSFRIHSAYR